MQAVEQKQVQHITGRRKSFHVYLVPRVTFVCEKTLEELGVRGSIDLGSLGIEYFPMDRDLLTCPTMFVAVSLG